MMGIKMIFKVYSIILLLGLIIGSMANAKGSAEERATAAMVYLYRCCCM